MLPGAVEGSATAAKAATEGLIEGNHLELQHLEEYVENNVIVAEKVHHPAGIQSHQLCGKHYLILPSCCKKIIAFKNKRSVQLAFSSHICFLLASAFYVKLSLIDLAWMQDSKNTYNIPDEVLDEDDDEVWSDWVDANGEYGATVGKLRDAYDMQSQIYYVLGASFFVLVGMIDWIHDLALMNILMILAGAAGVVSATSNTSRQEDIWNCISVHLFLLEAYTLVKRDSTDEDSVDGIDNEDDEGGEANDNRQLRAWLRVGDLCFLAGSILDVIVSYFYLAGLEGNIWIAYTDLTSCLLWLACPVIDLAAEIYYLKS